MLPWQQYLATQAGHLWLYTVITFSISTQFWATFHIRNGVLKTMLCSVKLAFIILKRNSNNNSSVRAENMSLSPTKWLKKIRKTPILTRAIFVTMGRVWRFFFYINTPTWYWQSSTVAPFCSLSVWPVFVHVVPVFRSTKIIIPTPRRVNSLFQKT